MKSEVPCILIADDEIDLARAFARMLATAGFTPVTVHDGASALTRLARGGIDVVISDIAMPALNGIALLREVRRRDQDLPVILVTGGPRWT